jgi:hypothetical protein
MFNISFLCVSVLIYSLFSLLLISSPAPLLDHASKAGEVQGRPWGRPLEGTRNLFTDPHEPL